MEKNISSMLPYGILNKKEWKVKLYAYLYVCVYVCVYIYDFCKK